MRRWPRGYPDALIRDSLQQLVVSAIADLIQSGRLPEAVREVRVEITDTKQPEHGDYACNFALTASKAAGMNPRQLGEMLKEALGVGREALGASVFQSIEVAGPGFLNLRLDSVWQASFVPKILDLGESLPNAQGPRPQAKKINVEFVSVNPNGPITIGSGRGAAYGSTLCNVLEAAGNTVHREYYINDGVNSEQMRVFSESIRSSILGVSPPENGYKGDYVADAASEVETSLFPPTLETKIKGFASGEFAYTGSTQAYSDHMAEIYRSILDKCLTYPDRKECVRHLTTEELQRLSEWSMTFLQAQALGKFGVDFDTWFSEQSLHDSGVVNKEIEHMIASKVADENEVRSVLKLARGGVIEDVEIQDQAGKAEVAEDEGLGTGDQEPEGNAGEADLEIGGPLKTLWLRSTKFGDDMDRVLRRRDGRLTYIASDVAYHKDKLLDESGVRRTGPVDKMITILGPDHHGYIGRLQAVVAAMIVAEGLGTKGQGTGEPLSEIDAKIFASPEERDICQAALAEAKEKLEVQIFQLVRFVKDGKPAPMRKRDGNIYALIDLMREIGEKVKPNGSEEEKLEAGKDVARFFYLMRSHDTTFDFDLDLAQKQSDENPVFYVQYAHARICSVIGKAEEAGLRIEGLGDPNPDTQSFNPAILVHDRELALIRKICDLPFEVQRSAEDYGVHRLATFAIELARTYHHFYDACRVIQPDQAELSRARLALCEATRTALLGTLRLLGISAPERMERAEPSA